MKITKRQLKRIIQEEKTKLLKESRQGTFESSDLKLIATVVDNLTEMALGYDADDETRSELLMQVELLNDVYQSLYNTTMGYSK